ncbi:MAG: potassium channel protein [Syntrophomonas sp.]|nr:potassium channel protein [Syntrophomonas sp.]
MSESRLKLFSAILAMLGITIVSTGGLVYFEGWSIFNAFWVTIISLTTTGYGDIVPQTMGGRLFLLGVLVTGVGIVAYCLGAIINILVESQISKILEKDKMSKIINKLDNHVIVCGAGRVGSNVAYILKAEQVPYLLIERDEELVGKMREEGHLVMLGDATQDETLQVAGIHRARGIICALSEDAYNVFVVLTARAINPGLKIVARAVNPETVGKLHHAGADKVISPTQIGGHQMAMAMLKPATVELVDTLFTSRNLEIQLEEVVITEQSSLIHKAIKDVFNRRVSNVIVVAIIRDDGVVMNPQGHDIVLPGDTLVLFGSRQDLEKMETSSFK